MTTKIENYIGEGFINPVQLKVNDELLTYVQQAVLDLKYRNPQLYLRDLIYTHRLNSIGQESLKNPEGIPKESLQESLDYQGIPVKQTPFEIIGKLVNETVLDLPKSLIDTPKSINDTTVSINDLPESKIDTPKSISDLPESTLDLSQAEIPDEILPEGISATQYRMYVRRLEDENVKLTDALKVCHKALEGNQKQGDLSAMLYQSELAMQQTISWVYINFQQFFPQNDVRQILTESVRNYYPNFPFYKLPNQ